MAVELFVLGKRSYRICLRCPCWVFRLLRPSCWGKVGENYLCRIRLCSWWTLRLLAIFSHNNALVIPVVYRFLDRKASWLHGRTGAHLDQAIWTKSPSWQPPVYLHVWVRSGKDDPIKLWQQGQKVHYLVRISSLRIAKCLHTSVTIMRCSTEPDILE